MADGSSAIDEDVAIENERVASGAADNSLIVVNDLTKVYDNGKRAVDHLSLGIPAGECFGLLGINGAGKCFCFWLDAVVICAFAALIYLIQRIALTNYFFVLLRPMYHSLFQARQPPWRS